MAVRNRGKAGAMGIRVQTIGFDCNHPSELAQFWQQLLGWRRTHDDGEEVVLEPPAGSPEDGVSADLIFLRVPEGKQLKNRLHLDLRPDDQAAEVARALELGATHVSIGQGGDVTWVVLADPEGNEFCILRALTPEELAGG
jgi:hypothetical protein